MTWDRYRNWRTNFAPKTTLGIESNYVAVAPKMDSYQRILLGLWEVFSTLDKDRS